VASRIASVGFLVLPLLLELLEDVAVVIERFHADVFGLRLEGLHAGVRVVAEVLGTQRHNLLPTPMPMPTRPSVLSMMIFFARLRT
jgi:hypothetical protein